jgi:hypothetical protein
MVSALAPSAGGSKSARLERAGLSDSEETGLGMVLQNQMVVDAMIVDTLGSS